MNNELDIKLKINNTTKQTLDNTYSYINFIKEYILKNDYSNYIESNINNTNNLKEIIIDIKNNLDIIYDLNNENNSNLKFMIHSMASYEFNNIINLKKRVLLLKKQVSKLQQLDLPEQRSKEWFNLRKNVLTASSLASALGECHFTTRDELILDKSSDEEKPYKSNPITEWGVKYEEIATKFYELINNVKIIEFGLIPHPNFKIFGASPDGICSNDSPDEFVGRMLEIKCPPKRKFTKSVPSHYGYQMQGQLECCNLEECDFLQVKIEEYDNIDEYNNDKYIYNGIVKEGYTCNNYPKGCTITYQKTNSLSFSYLYPELCLSFQEYSDWIEENKQKIIKNGDTFIEAKWWKIERYECTLVKRNREWWINNIEKIYNFWEEVKYYRNNDKTSLINRIKQKNNKRKSDFMNNIENIDKCLITL
jgi:putative phage-type endonuclease